MQIKATLALLALAAGAASASSRGTLPTYLDLQSKYYAGTLTPASAEYAQLVSLGKELHAQGVPMRNVVGTGSQGQELFKAFGLNVAALLQPSTLAARSSVVDVEALDQAKQIGTVPAFLLAMNKAFAAKDATNPQMVALGSELLAQGTSAADLKKMLGTDSNGVQALQAVQSAAAVSHAEKRDVPVKALLTPAAAGANVPTGNVPAFQYYVAQLWADPLSALNDAALVHAVELGQKIRAENGDRALASLLGNTAPAKTILAQIHAGGAKKRHMQKQQQRH